MTLHLPLLFHFNQALSQHAQLASHVCYRGLLRVLLDAPVKSNIHISGTLVQALNWLDPEPLNLIRTGLETGKFELVGSTHAQNVAFASDDEDNRDQIRLHRKILEQIFNARPTAFWNPERCWRQSLLPRIADEGYRLATVEDHILDRSGASQPVMYRTELEGRTLAVVRDDERLKHLFNFAAWFGIPEKLFEYLEQRSMAGRQSVLAYAEDAEALGLWGYYRGIHPAQTLARLADLLARLAELPFVRTAHFRDLPPPAAAIQTIRDGSAAWMDASLARPGLPYHEDGFRDWMDFNTSSPKLAHFRSRYRAIRAHIEAAEANPAAAKGLIDLARHCYLSHQYEFGCIGIGGTEARVWRGADAAVALARIAAAQPGTTVSDLNLDGLDEHVLASRDLCAVVTPIGGRVLYLADLQGGKLHVGTPSSLVFGQYEGESYPPAEARFPAPWQPDAAGNSAVIETEAPPTRMGRYLPEWIWEDNPGPFTLAVNPSPQPGGEEVTLLNAQQGAFCDSIRLNGEAIFLPNTRMEAGIDGFAREIAPGLHLEKQIRLTQDGVEAVYRLSGAAAARLEIRTLCEISCDYGAVLENGRRALDFLPSGVVCRSSGSRVTVESSLPPQRIEHGEALLALIVALDFVLDLSPGVPHEHRIRMVRE